MWDVKVSWLEKSLSYQSEYRFGLFPILLTDSVYTSVVNGIFFHSICPANLTDDRLLAAMVAVMVA